MEMTLEDSICLGVSPRGGGTRIVRIFLSQTVVLVIDGFNLSSHPSRCFDFHFVSFPLGILLYTDFEELSTDIGTMLVCWDAVSYTIYKVREL